ncbi:MAG TPA: endonuclease III [Vicinamibacteria bacterium]|nr:endonuclease III [Vicinamibacteria bacterium]
MKAKAPARRRRAPARRGRRSRASRATTAARAGRILDVLERTHPDATCALHYRTPWELLAATILSAQCTDERVNRVTPALFARYPAPADMAAAAPAEVQEIIRSTGFFNSKTKSLIGCAKALVAGHAGEVPRSLDALVKLPGVGRKTASVVLGHTYGTAEGIAVDTHVLRVSNRLGLAKGEDAGEVEAQLMKLIPRERWIRTTDLLIFHGRRICDARRPACGRCPLFGLCGWESRQAWATQGAP